MAYILVISYLKFPFEPDQAAMPYLPMELDGKRLYVREINENGAVSIGIYKIPARLNIINYSEKSGQGLATENPHD